MRVKHRITIAIPVFVFTYSEEIWFTERPCEQSYIRSLWKKNKNRSASLLKYICDRISDVYNWSTSVSKRSKKFSGDSFSVEILSCINLILVVKY